jgi:nitrogen fixation protein FixH
MSATSKLAAGAKRPREVTGRMVLICLVAFFAVVAAVNAVMMRAAVTTFGGLETESSYKAGLAFAREIAASEAQEARHWRVSALVGPVSADTVRIELTALDARQRPLVGYDATARLAHPTDRRRDQIIDLRATGPGRFTGQGTASPGQRDLVIELTKDDERMFRSRERITLKSAAP